MPIAPKCRLMRLVCLFLSAVSFLGCSPVTEGGVPFSLASQRADFLSDVHYSLGFDLTREAGKVTDGKLEVIQSERITNPDRKETFRMLCLAASPDSDVRNALFASFLESARNRRPESRVLSALALLCHRSRQEEALAYIVPSLDALEEIQRTGDIFFPDEWCSVLLQNQRNDRAKKIVDDWLVSHPEINPLLATKVLQALDR